jgi:hypothetical protein
VRPQLKKQINKKPSQKNQPKLSTTQAKGKTNNIIFSIDALKCLIKCNTHSEKNLLAIRDIPHLNKNNFYKPL